MASKLVTAVARQAAATSRAARLAAVARHDAAAASRSAGLAAAAASRAARLKPRMTGAAAIRGTTEEKIVKCSIVSGVPGPLFILDKVKVFEDTSGVDNKYTIVQFTGEYKGGAAEGGRRPSIWNIFEQRSTPAPSCQDKGSSSAEVS
uniref:Uncharacterized protein n=1 Tax=Oryza meridionalis TaxID=40149 RepID=A0A0E0DTA4_9ORYZ